jgi:hypothetical protein
LYKIYTIHKMSKFSNNADDFFQNINKLPIEMVYEIDAYIPTDVKMFLNKKLYIQNHKNIISDFIDKKQIENYIRVLVRQDNDFSFKFLLEENIHNWLKIKKYLYKNAIYMNYVVFLQFYCDEHESHRCKELILQKMDELGLLKNQHKKNVVKYINTNL